jgi:folate-dependent phosphoribosylglycinamide formyltransferase PurN
MNYDYDSTIEYYNEIQNGNLQVTFANLYDFMEKDPSFDKNDNGTCNKPHEYGVYSLSLAGFVAYLSLKFTKRYSIRLVNIMFYSTLKNHR